MKWHRVGVTALAVLLLGAGSWLLAQENRDRSRAEGQNRGERFASWLGLSAEQKEQVHKIHQKYDAKEDQLEDQIRHQRHEEREALEKILTSEQRAKAPDLLREVREQRLHEIAERLNLTKEQREHIGKIRHEYSEKIDHLDLQKGDDVQAKIRDLRRHEFEAIRNQLTADQREKVPGIMREEFQEWRNPAETRKRLRALADKLGMNEDQRRQARETHSRFDKEIDKLEDQLRDVRHQEREEVSKVLTSEQRDKLRQAIERRGGGEGRTQERR